VSVDGFLLVDKASGWTSHDVIAKLRGALRIKKMGHAGTLDPMATGLLVVGVGRATRLLRFVQAAPKVYEATALFGVATDSFDADGAVLERTPLPVEADELEAVMQRFVGTIHQVPPMVSARRIGGRRLYELAREGKEVDRDARPVVIHSLELLDLAPSDYPEVTFRVTCGTGTYVRTLADDLAGAMGGRAHLTELRRIANGSLSVDGAATVEEIVALAEPGEPHPLMLAPGDGLPDLQAVVVDEGLSKAVGNGVAFGRPQLAADLEDGPVRLFDSHHRLLAIYRASGSRMTAEVVLP
jgi:tRNA pseudouridine55 synthase